jgi:hypothetical protein
VSIRAVKLSELHNVYCKDNEELRKRKRVKEEKDLEALPSIFRPPGQDNSHSFPGIKQKTWQTRMRILNIQEWWSVKNGRPSFLRLLRVVQLVEKFDCIELKRAGIANSLWEGRLQNRASIPGRGK